MLAHKDKHSICVVANKFFDIFLLHHKLTWA